ncbi:MAG: hypothetical protein DIU84_05375 [Bacillota bacterium]|nr:MAG: hypothetical protein DIU84_05375 [Bacillota bacterium]
MKVETPTRGGQLWSDACSEVGNRGGRVLGAGRPAEDARLSLPLGTRINLVMSVNARSLMHILDMRLPPNAQWEIRELCGALLDLAEMWMPATFRWYRENRAGKHLLAP